MTVELGPSDLPNSLSKILGSQEVPLLTSFEAITLLANYIEVIDNQKSSKMTKLYHLAKIVFQKKWLLDDLGPVEHILYNEYKNKEAICTKELDFLGQRCVALKRLTYLTAKGPSDGFYNGRFYLGKMLVL